MEKGEIIEIIISSLRTIISEQDKKAEIPIEKIDESTSLFGSRSFIDSLTLVSLLVDVEQKVNEENGISITIADERAMSQEKTPFRTIGSLADYVFFLVNDQRQNA
jgi:acyl carrier protein